MLPVEERAKYCPKSWPLVFITKFEDRELFLEFTRGILTAGSVGWFKNWRVVQIQNRNFLLIILKHEIISHVFIFLFLIEHNYYIIFVILSDLCNLISCKVSKSLILSILYQKSLPNEMHGSTTDWPDQGPKVCEFQTKN